MIWCSGCSPTPCSTSSWRTDAPCTARACAPSRIATVVALTAALALVFFYAPLDADQGFVQKIFYVHVPMAIVALCGFVAGGIFAIQHLRTRRPRAGTCAPTSRSTCALIFGVGVLITGSIWAKALVGPLVGVGRADARLVPDRLPALRDLPAAALLDRGPRAPGALRVGVRDHRRRVRAAQLHRRAAGDSATCTRACSRRPRNLPGADGAHVPGLAARRWRCCS